MRSRVKDYLGCGILAHGFARARDRYLDVQDRERAAGAVGARDADGSSEAEAAGTESARRRWQCCIEKCFTH